MTGVGQSRKATRPETRHGGGTKRGELVVAEILEQAAKVFARRGFAGTGMGEVAKELGLTRTALYHYFTSKEDLLEQLVSGITRETADSLAQLRAESKQDVEALTASAFKSMVVRAATNRARFQLLERSAGELPEALEREHRKARSEVIVNWDAILADYLDSYHLTTDAATARIITLSLLGISTWVAWWYNPARDPAPDEVADVLWTLTSSGLTAGLSQSVHEGADSRDLDLVMKEIASLRSDILRLTPIPGEGI